MGFGTALGVATARRDSTTVLLTGDGGLLMTLGELETVAREDIPLVMVVLNDHALDAERHTLERHNLPIAKAVYPDIDFAAFADALGDETATPLLRRNRAQPRYASSIARSPSMISAAPSRTIAPESSR
jgi:thiamine pyrophosphate-dependent acetolactate synthase large subunit-like protein